ncbi:hypothetical protein [Glycomyces xiaoerkulensis]|uniref:hypothetical protein n=1 Tax=Glycomyces xiaoerkulensis TaxID=2038139 RepID=UPI000C260FEE|nr:hypothetical protein [Glycomyces xiaoerkulensis]
MSDPSAPGEIRLEIQGDPEPEPRTGHRPAPPRVPNAALAVVTALLLVAAAALVLVKWHPGNRTAAEEAVAEFLNAARDGEVERALELAGTEHRGEPLYEPEALDDRWEVATVAQVEFDDDDQEAVVYAEIEGHDGNRVGNRFTVEIGGDAPVVADGIASIFTTGVSFGVSINGLEPTGDEVNNLRFLPGLYEIREPGTWYYEEVETEVLVLGDQVKSRMMAQQGLDLPSQPTPLSEAGREAVDAAVRDFLDTCLETPGDPCPFGLPDDDRLTRTGPWEIASYPESAPQSAIYVYNSIELATRAAGEARVEVEVAGEAAEAVTIACDLRVDGASAHFAGEGEVELEWDPAETACETAVAVD